MAKFDPNNPEHCKQWLEGGCTNSTSKDDLAFAFARRTANQCGFECHGDYWTTGCGEEVHDSSADIYHFCPWCGSPILIEKE
jgi:hypothetical protein